jgi:para-aminobenzoate synthetase / 4-amino-4-deoxychorismate lyase
VPVSLPKAPLDRRPDVHKGVLETLLVLDGRPVELDAHLARLKASLASLFPTLHHPPLDVPSLMHPYGRLSDGTSEMAHLGDAALRITVAPAGNQQLQASSSIREVERPRGAVALHSLRLRGGLGAHKWADRSLLDQAQSELQESTLPLIVDADSAVLEASRANVFAVRDGALFTPPLDGRILPGITRMRVLQIAASIGVEVREARLSREDLLTAEEVFLTGSVRGIEPVDSLDRTALAGGGAVTGELATELRRAWLGASVG